MAQELPMSPLEQFNSNFLKDRPEAEDPLEGQAALDEFNRQYFGQDRARVEQQNSFALEDNFDANGSKDASIIAKDSIVEKESGVNPSDVAQSLPKRAELMRLLGTTPEQFSGQYPRLTKGFIDDSTMLAIAKHDIGRLKKLEDTLREYAPSVDEEGTTSGWDSNEMAYDKNGKTWLAGSVQGAIGTLGSGLLGAMQFLAESAYETTDARFLRDMSLGIKETQGQLKDWADKQFLAGTKDFGTGASWIAGGTQSGFMNVATFATGLALAALVAASGGTAAPAIALWANLGLMGLSSFGNAYSEGKQQGLSTLAASGHGLAQGGLEVATEFLPQKFLGDALGPKAILKNLTPENKKFVQNVMKYTFTDVAGEQVNTILGGLESWAVLPENQDKTFIDFLSELPEDMAQTFVATLTGSGVTVAAGTALSNAVGKVEGTLANRIGRDFVRQNDALRGMAVIKTIDEIAMNAEVANVAPEMLPGLISKAVGDGIETAFIDSQVFYQKADVKAKVVEIAPELADKIDQAVENGQDVEMSVETLTKLVQSQSVRDMLYQDVRLSKDGITPRQAQENLMQLGEDAKRIFDESLNNVAADRRVVLEKIQGDVANQMVAVGHTRENARLQGQLWSSFINAMAERTGMDPDVLYEKYKPTIQASNRFGEVPKRVAIPKTLPKRTVERQARVRQSGAGSKRATFAPTAVTSEKPVIIQNRDRSRPGLVSQMHKIAAAPNYQMVSFSRDFGNGAPVVAYGSVSESQLGREDFAVTAKGESIRVRYAVVEADSVLTSNNVDGTVNPEYNSADASKMRAIAGNGRIAGLQEAFNRNTTAQYVDAMKADAETTGIDASVVEGMKKPILVRIMPAESVTADIGDVSNTSTTAQLSDFQQAKNDAERLDFDKITFTEDGTIDESSVIDFIHQMPVSEQDTLITKNGRPTQRAYDRLTYALIAKAYQDDELTQLATESTGEEAKNVFKALVAVAPKYVRLLDSEYDLRDVIAGVAHLAIDAQRKGVSLESHIGLSGDLDLGAAQVGRANVADPSTIKVAQEVAKVTRSYKSVQSLFSTIADEAFDEMLQADSNETDMFGGAVTRSREDVVDGAIQAYQSAGAEGQLFQAAIDEYFQSAVNRPNDAPKASVEVVGLTKAPFNSVDAAVEWAENNNVIGTMTNEETGGKGEIQISKGSVREMLNSRQRRKSASVDVHFAALQKVREIVRTSVIAESHPDYVKGEDGKRSPENGINDKVTIDVAYGCVEFEGNYYRVKTTLKRYKDPKTMDKAYAYEVSELEVLAGNLVNAETGTNHTSSTAVPVSILLKDVKTVNGLDAYVLYQRAWHASPHIFDQFSLDHIGTGEGGQAHGWGLYFAKLRKVAERYRNALAGSEILFKGKDISQLRNRLAAERDYEKVAVIDEFMDKQSISALRDEVPSLIEDEMLSQEAWDWFEKEIAPNIKQAGRLFEVEIPESDVLLDEQKTFEKQPKKVQDAIVALLGPQKTYEHLSQMEAEEVANNLSQEIEHAVEELNNILGESGLSIDVTSEDLKAIVVDYLLDASRRSDDKKLYSFQADAKVSIFEKLGISLDDDYVNRFAWSQITNVLDAAQANLGWRDADTLAMQKDRRVGRNIYQELVEKFGSPRQASIKLNEQGVKGITYTDDLDGRCFVVFDDKAIKVVEFLQEQSEPRGAYNPADRTISLFRKQNMSTFLHESGHAFLDIMFDLAGMENAPADLVRDVQTILEWFGVESVEAWNALSFEQKTVYHEKFARGFESYLRKGKAPSTGLRRAFSRFKQWLVTLYKRAEELDVEVTPQIKEVMDRMLASEAEISQAQSINRLANLWTEKNFPGTPTQWEEYQELLKDSDELARAQHNATLLAEMAFMRNRVEERRAELDKQYRDEYQKARQQAIEELNADPVYQMIQDFQGEDKPKLSTVEVAQIGDKELQAVGAHGILADDGYSLEPTAQTYGYNDDPVQFIEVIANTKPFDEAVELRAHEIMEENNEELLSDEQRQESAELAALNDLTLRRVENEYKVAAANKANADVRAAAKEWAEETVENTRVRMLDQNQYRVQAEKFARVAVQAAAQHNSQGVAEAKRKQLVNLYAQRETLKAKNRVRQTEKLARRLNRSFKKKLRKGQQDQEFMDQVLGLMHRFGLLEGEYKTNRSFADFKADFEDGQGVPLSMIDESLFEGAGRNYQDLTYAEFDSLRNAIDMLLHQGRRVRTVVREGQREAIEKIVERLDDELVDTFEKNVPTEKNKFAEGIKGYLMDHLKLSNLVRMMVGGRDTSTLHNVILDPLNAAGEREVTMLRDAADKLNKLTNEKLGKSSMTAKVKIVTAKGPEMLTLSTRLAIALNCGNRQNRERLMASANGFNKASINQVLSSLTKSELEWVQAVWDLIDSYWPMIAEVERRTNGLPPQKIEASPFEVALPDNTVVKMKGGYYPIKYDSENSVEAARNEMKAFGEGIVKGAFGSATTKQGFAKKRSEGVNRKLQLDLFVIGSHLKEVIHDITFRETLQDINRLVRNGDFARMIQDRFGARYYKQITDTILDVASDGSGASMRAALHPALQYLKGNATFAALAASVTTVFLQPLGILQSIQRIGFSNVLKGYVTLAKQGSMQNIEKTCLNKSEFMRNRKFTMNAELNEIGRRLQNSNSKFVRGVDAVEKVLYAPMQGFQIWTVDIATWYGAYQRAYSEGASDEQAIKIADQTVRDAQGSGLISDQSPFQRNHPLMTVFYSYFSSTLNLVADSWNENVRSKSTVSGSLLFVRDLMMLAAVPTIISELVFSLLRGDDWEDREPEDWAKLGVSATVGSLLSMFVGLREFTSVLNGYTYTGPIVGRVVNDAGRLGYALAAEDKDPSRVTQSALALMSNVTKIPAAQINRTWKGVEAYAEGETDAPTAVLFGPPRK